MPLTTPVSKLQRTVLGDGEMARLVRAFHWDRTSLGVIESWSKELLSLVNVSLASPMPMLLYWGPDLLLIYNDAARAILSGKHPNVLGSAAALAWKEAWHLVGEEFAAVLSSGQSVHHESVLVPVEQDGVLQQLFWDYSCSPAYEDGKIAGLLVVCTDVTEAINDRAALKSTADQLDRVLGTTSDAIFSLDRAFRFTFINPRAYQVMGHGPEILGSVLWETFPGTVYNGSPYVEHYSRAMHEQIPGSFEAYYPEPLNVWLYITAHPTEEGITVFFRDITDQKKREKVLIRTEKLAAVGRMAAAISHEINNPLEAITNLLYLARREQDSSKLHAYLDDADRELRRVGNIVNQSLRFHRQASNPTEVTCVDLFSTVLSMYESRLSNARIKVEKRKRAGRPVAVYEGDIRQVLNNLVANALDAMPGGGRLLVRSRDATDWPTGRRGLVLTVADTGSGIDPDNKEHLFEPFFTTKGIGGSGLGLWVSSEIVQRHGGRLQVRSKCGTTQHGTVFTIFLPFDSTPLPT